MDTEKFYRACEIYSVSELEARDAIPSKKLKAREYRPSRAGLLPISRSRFYELIDEGRFPTPDAKLGRTPLWSGKLLQSALSHGPD
jgi:hypothetical protein